jgi:predicted nucleotidyltransferase
VRSGSHLYGLNHDQSDEDSLGVFIDTPRRTLGFAPYQTIKNPDSDETYKTLSDYAQHLANGSSFWVETLFAPDTCVIVKHPAFDCFIRQRNAFLTQALITKSLGFIEAMTRLKLSEDTPNIHKQLSHAVRVGYMIERWINTGVFEVQMSEHRDELMDIKFGRSSIHLAHDKAKKMYEHIDGQLQKCGLPEDIGNELLNDMVTEATFAYWSCMGEM